MTLSADLDHLLTRYAELLVRIGVNLQPGGKLLLSAPLEAAAVVRKVASAAWDAGAVEVDVRFSDPHLARLRIDQAPVAALGYAPDWAMTERLHMIADGYSFVSLVGEDHAIMQGANPDRVAQYAKTRGLVNKPISEKMMAFEAAWSLGAFAFQGWADKVYPDLRAAERVPALWKDIFAVTRADQPDPVAAWEAHIGQLGAVRDYLNTRHFAAVHFKDAAGDTDLMVGLADGHIWGGAEDRTASGIRVVPNMPTDEVFTAPHRERVDGVAVASKPLVVRGEVVEGIRVRFAGGQVVEASASKGEATFLKLLDTDEGARHLGEVALVSASAPVAATGRLFYNTLFDENAASHIALGRAYELNLSADRAQSGGNDSLIHVDWMIGTPTMQVDGVTADGRREVLMRGGEWVMKAR